jgi:chemotaxis protein MotC
MSRCLHVALAFGIALSAVIPAAAQEKAKEPYELVRDLGALQDQTVRGDAAAHSQQRKLTVEIAERMASFDAAVWRDPRNVRAIVTYVLSGGEPRVLKSLFAQKALPGVDEKLLNGALAYAEGRNTDALELLGAIDARSLEANLGAHVALVQAALVAGKDPKRAITLLDDARLLAPGTVIEDGALRRQVFAVAASGDVIGFETLASQYLRRFPNSIYAGSFRDQFVMEVVSERYGQAPERLQRLDSVLQGLDGDNRRQYLLAIAQEAVTRGRVALARYAAANAVPLTSEGSLDHMRAKLYEAAALIVTDDYEKGFATLQFLDKSQLEARDAALLDIALAVAAEVRRQPEAVEDAPSISVAKDTDQKTPLPGLRIVERAQQVIARADAMLSERAK